MNNSIKVRDQYVRSFFKSFIPGGVLVVACLIGVTAQAQLIDDFSSGILTQYNQTIVLAQSADPAFTFSAGSGVLSVTRASGTAPQQDVFLRGDYSLGVGQILRVDALSVSNFASGNYADFGIVLSDVTNPPPAVYSGSNVDTRQNLINVYLKNSTGAVGYRFANGTTQIASSSGIFPTNGFDAVIGLWISRPSSNEYDVGYTTVGLGDFLLKATNMVNTAIGNSIGFYADVRTVWTDPSTLDNLRIAAIPEPSTLVLMGLGLGLSAMVLRRKRA